MQDQNGRLHINTPLMAESLVDKALLRGTETGTIFHPLHDLKVAKLGGRSIIDRGRVMLPLLDEIAAARVVHPLPVMTGGDTRSRHASTPLPSTWICPPACWPSWAPASASRTR
jgi:molybdenum storage protein